MRNNREKFMNNVLELSINSGKVNENAKYILYRVSYLRGGGCRLLHSECYRLRSRSVMARVRSEPRDNRAPCAESRGYFHHLCTDL